MRFSSVAFGLSHLLIEQPRPQGAFPWLWRWGAREKRPGDEVVDWVILHWCACGADGRSSGRSVYGHVITRLHNSPYFCVFSHARTAKQTIWNEAENREPDWGETLKIRFFSLASQACEARAPRAPNSYATLYRFLYWFWEKTPTALQSTWLPNFLGWVDLLRYGAPHTRLSRALGVSLLDRILRRNFFLLSFGICSYWIFKKKECRRKKESSLE